MRATGFSLAVVFALLLGAVCEASAQQPAVQPSATSRAPEPPGPPVPLGPFPVTIEADPTLPTHTIYRPTDLAAAGLGPLPIVVWGNGACVNDGTRYINFLTKVASHGFLIVAIGPITQEGEHPGATIVRLPDPSLAPAPNGRTQGSQLIDGLEWAIGEATRAGSRFAGRIDARRVGVMGMSCGGLQALEVAADPRITTMMIWNSGVFNDGGRSGLSGATKEGLADIHSSIAYINGGPSDIAYENSNDDVRRIEGVPLFYGVMKEGGHGGTFRHVNGGRFAEVGANWLLWTLRGDEQAGLMFVGDACELCRDPGWTVQKKNMR
jgi:hypothetical protein